MVMDRLLLFKVIIKSIVKTKNRLMIDPQNVKESY